MFLCFSTLFANRPGSAGSRKLDKAWSLVGWQKSASTRTPGPSSEIHVLEITQVFSQPKAVKKTNSKQLTSTNNNKTGQKQPKPTTINKTYKSVNNQPTDSLKQLTETNTSRKGSAKGPCECHRRMLKPRSAWCRVKSTGSRSTCALAS